MHSLAYNGSAIELDPGMLWVDEFAWLPNVSRAQRAIDGTLLIEASALPSGRPITLAGGETHGWITRGTVKALREWLAVPGRVMSLTLDDGRVFQVIAAPGEQALDATMLSPWGRPGDDEYYVATLRLIGV